MRYSTHISRRVPTHLLRRLVALVGLLLPMLASSPSAHATEDPSELVNGVYVGHEVGKPARLVTIELRAGSFVLLDAAAIQVARTEGWAIAGPGGKTGRLTWKAQGVALASMSRAGKPQKVRVGAKSALRFELEPESGAAVLCATSPGARTPAPSRLPSPGATESPEPGVTCFALRRVDRLAVDAPPTPSTGEPDFECMRECRQQNMMRAVGPELIEEDCRKACSR